MEINVFVEDIVRHLVDNPEELSVTCVEGEKVTVFEIRVNPSDVGKVIGKNGRTIRSLRTLVGAVAARAGIRSMLEIVE
ncbi:MAG: KH domain-containing protein [Candidatus Tritonobacter lacicola]|nr:KH domain-containing protein [Candidatus Tritonobacter lacicola]